MAKAVTAAPTVQGTPSPPGTTAGARKKKWATKVKTGCLTCRFESPCRLTSPSSPYTNAPAASDA